LNRFAEKWYTFLPLGWKTPSLEDFFYPFNAFKCGFSGLLNRFALKRDKIPDFPFLSCSTIRA